MNIKPIQILLIEDNEGDILLTTDALLEGNLLKNITVVRDGWEAIQFLEKKDHYKDALSPDLIILDINLPKLNGHEVLKKIKSNENTKQIPVIILTTSSAESDILSCYRNYANTYITKPIDIKNFLDMIDSIENFWLSIAQLSSKVKIA